MVFYVVWGCRCVRLEVKDITQSEADALLAELLRMRNRRQDAAAAAAVDPPIIVPEAAATVTPGRGSGSATSTAPATKAAYADARGFAERTATWLTSLCFSNTCMLREAGGGTRRHVPQAAKASGAAGLCCGHFAQSRPWASLLHASSQG